MNKWKLAFYVIFVIWILTGTVLIYALLDVSTTLMYHDASYDWAVKDIKELSEIILSKEYTKKDISEVLNVTHEMYEKYWQEDKIQLNDTYLIFKNDTLVNIINYK